MRRLWVGRGPSSSLLLLLTSLGLGSTARPPGRTVSTSLSLLLLIGFTSSGRPPGATEEHTIRYNGDVNIGQCLTFHCLSLLSKSWSLQRGRQELWRQGSHLYRPVPGLKLKKEDVYEPRTCGIYSLRQCIKREYVRWPGWLRRCGAGAKTSCIWCIFPTGAWQQGNSTYWGHNQQHSHGPRSQPVEKELVWN